MDRFNWYYRQRVSESDLDGLQDRIEAALTNLQKDLFTYGWLVGGDITPGSGTAVSVPPHIGYDQYGQRIAWSTPQTVNLTAQKPGTPGQSRWVLIAGRFKRALSDLRTDGHGQQVYFKEDESYEIVQRAGTAAASPSKPTKQAGDVVLGYVKVAYGATSIVAGDIDHVGKEIQGAHQASAIGVADAAGNFVGVDVETVLEEIGGHIGSKSNPHRVTAVQVGAPTTAEVESMIRAAGGTWIEPGNTVLLTAPTVSTVYEVGREIVKQFRVAHPGRYRIKGKVRCCISGCWATVRFAYPQLEDGRGRTVFTTTSSSWVSFAIDDESARFAGEVISIELEAEAQYGEESKVEICDVDVCGVVGYAPTAQVLLD